jgi:hypothetical protein
MLSSRQNTLAGSHPVVTTLSRAKRRDVVSASANLNETLHGQCTDLGTTGRRLGP